MGRFQLHGWNEEVTKSDRITRVEEQLKSNTEMTHRIHEAIFGNGKPGLKADMHALKNAVHVLCWLVSALIAIAGVVGAFIH